MQTQQKNSVSIFFFNFISAVTVVLLIIFMFVGGVVTERKPVVYEKKYTYKNYVY